MLARWLPVRSANEPFELGALQAQILDQVHDSAVAMDLTGRIVMWNSGAVRLYGYSAAEAIGQHISLITESTDPGAFGAEQFRQLFKSGFKKFDTIARTKSGCLHPVHVRLSLIRDVFNAPAGVLGLAADTTDLQRARAELQDRERQLQTILDAVPVCVAQVDPQLRLKFTNRAYRTLVNRSNDDLVGLHVKETLQSNYESQLPDIHKVLGGTPLVTETEIIGADGQRRSLVIQRIPDINAEGVVQGYFAVATDVTETKRIHVRRLEDERRLRETLISEVHHRVKNSLQGIVGLLRAQAAKNPDIADALAPAIAQVLSISVGFGLTSTRGENGIVLCDMVREIGRNLEQITGARILTEVDRAVVDRPIVLDRSEAVNLGMVVNELIFNAVKHGSAEGTDQRIRVLISHENQSSSVRISNHVDSTLRQFDFRSGTGLGTGLTLVRALLRPCRSKLSFVLNAGQLMAILTLGLDDDAPTLEAVRSSQ